MTGLQTAIAMIMIAATLATIVLYFYAIRERWDVPRFGGVLVKFEVTALKELVQQVRIANEETLSILKARYPSKKALHRYRVIVVPNGSIPGGHGTTRTEFIFPYLIDVARVEEHEAGYLIAHEVSQHVVARHLKGHADGGHRLVEFDELEQTIKNRITARLRGG